MVVSNTGKYIASGQKTYQGFKVSNGALFNFLNRSRFKTVSVTLSLVLWQNSN